MRLRLAVLTVLALGTVILLRSRSREDPSSPATSLGGAVVERTEAPEDAARRERILRWIEESDTYLGPMLRDQDSVLRRWPDRREPLRVFLPRTADLEGWRPELRRAAETAFLRWSQVADQPVRFRFLPDTVGADVRVRWVRSFTIPRAGQADIVWDGEGRIVRATLTLATHHHGGRLLADDAVYTVALHEIGHLIGLGHSDQPADVMAASTEVHDLTARDRRTAQLLYALPPGSLKGR